MGLDRVTAISGLLVYGYGTTTILTTTNPTSPTSLLSGLASLLAFTTIYLGTMWFLIWLDHTYYPTLQTNGGGEP